MELSTIVRTNAFQTRVCIVGRAWYEAVDTASYPVSDALCRFANALCRLTSALCRLANALCRLTSALCRLKSALKKTIERSESFEQ